jgi:uncharacterized protein (DUF305 family)
MAVAVMFLGGAIGYLVAPSNFDPDAPGAHSVDVGFLQDMRLHHDQAVQMAFIMLDKPINSGNTTLRSIAYEIARDQQNEMGRMYQMLADWNLPTDSDSDTVMAWMDDPLPSDKMPGLASTDDLTQLRNDSGNAADVLFAKLMIAHHQGGIHMAQYAAAHATTSRVRTMASAMVVDQQEEINEMTKLMGLPTTPA